jgi:ribosomal protein S18 acetylase RimI-like enzyme
VENFEIIEFDPYNKKQMNLITSIHKSVLPDSFVVMMGPVFMKNFYYLSLPQLRFLKCFLALYEGKFVGMIVTNRKPFSLIRSAIPHRFVRICWVMGISLLSNFRRIKVLADLIKYKPDPLLKKFEDSGKAFEILTIGVLEEYRNITLDDGMKISHKLLKHVVQYYKDLGYAMITGQILKSNKGALGFYRKYNANFIQSSVRDFGVIMDLAIKNIN